VPLTRRDVKFASHVCGGLEYDNIASRSRQANRGCKSTNTGSNHDNARHVLPVPRRKRSSAGTVRTPIAKKEAALTIQPLKNNACATVSPIQVQA